MLYLPQAGSTYRLPTESSEEPVFATLSASMFSRGMSGVGLANHICTMGDKFTFGQKDCPLNSTSPNYW